MILRLCMEAHDPQGMRISYQFKNQSTNEIYATASDNFKEPIKLLLDNKEYQFFNHPKFVEKINLNIKYPIYSKRKKTVGFYILEDNKPVSMFYGETAICGKKGIFKRNIGFTVFEYNNCPYMLYRVGFPKQKSHYYCLYNNDGQTVAIIERHSYYKDDCKATVYIEKEENVLIALLACTEEIISVANSGNNDDMMDTSAGHYVSRYEEEKALFDKSFIDRVKAL